MREKPVAKHIQILINEILNLDYYVTNNLHPLSPTIGKQVFCEQIIVNYELKNKNKRIVQKVAFDNIIFYEINFEQAYLHLPEIGNLKLNKLEKYLLNFIKLFFKDNATDLVCFLKSLNCMQEENLLEIENIFNNQKSQHYKERLLS